MSTLKWGGQDVSSVKWGTEDVNEIKWVDSQGVTTTAWTSSNPYFDNLDHLDAVDITELPSSNNGGTDFFGIYSASHTVTGTFFGNYPPNIYSYNETNPTASYLSKSFNFTMHEYFLSLSGMYQNYFNIKSTSSNWNFMVVHNPTQQEAYIFRKEDATLIGDK